MYAASMLVLSIVFMMSVNPAISYCPTSGIYLLHRGHCYHNGSYFWDSRIKGSRIDCKFPVALLSGGEWIGPTGKVPCPGERANLKCSFYQGYAPSTRISLYLPYYGGKYLDASGDGWYKCCLPSSCSDPNTNIIFANIFRFAQIESFYAADLPSDMTVYPQKYKLNCTKIGHKPYTISIKLGNTSLANYTNCNDGNNSPCPGDIINGDTNTVRYTFDITWDGRTATIGSSNNLITGDQMYKCFLDNNGGPNRTRTLTIKVPDTAPSSLTVINKTATTITVSWTPLDSSDADGYVVNVTNDTNATVQTIQVEGNTNNTITLDGLDIQIIYTITVRAYQQLLGPAGTCTISLQDLLGIDSINWTLVSSITQLNNTQYRIDCITTTDTNSSADAYWLVNGVMKSSSMYELIDDDDRTNNTLLIYPDPLGVSLTVSCIAIYGGVTYSEYVTLDAPDGPPVNVRGFILNSTSIKVNWTNSSETNGYVITYTNGGVLKTTSNEAVLTDLSPMSTYTIMVYSYRDLPSVNNTATILKLDVPGPVTSLSVTSVSTTGITLNWTIPSSINYVTYYTISYTPSCTELSSGNETVSVSPHQSTTTYSYTLTGLHSGMSYTITVRAGNVLGESDPMAINNGTLSTAPIGAPKNLVLFLLLESEYNVTWDELKCSEQNGLITGYTVMISNSSITYNITSTNTHITLNDLVFDTEYNISVAAVNAIGSGPFSDHITIVLHVSSPSSSIFLPSSSPTYYHTHATSLPPLLLLSPSQTFLQLSSSQTSPLVTSISYAPTPITTSPPISPNTTSIVAGVVLIVPITLIIIIVIVCIIRMKKLSKSKGVNENISMQQLHESTPDDW